MPPIILTVVGLIFLVASAYSLVEGASRMAYAFGVSELIVGLTIVAVGTSAPELMISIASGLQIRSGELAQNAGSDIIIGNVVGSNIANIGLILGIGAVIRTIRVDPTLLKRDYLWMLGATVLVSLFALDKTFHAWEGGILFIAMLAFSVFQYSLAIRAKDVEYSQPGEVVKRTPTSLLFNVGLIIVGIVGLALGSNWLVTGSTEIARDLGVGEFIIGLTLIAVGTSLPELSTSVVASLRHEGDILVGNIIGSNIYNLLLILAAGMLITPLTVADTVRELQIPLLLGLTFGLYPLMRARHEVRRIEGSLLLVAYMGIIGVAVLLNR